VQNKVEELLGLEADAVVASITEAASTGVAEEIAPVVDMKQLRCKQLHHAIDESEKSLLSPVIP